MQALRGLAILLLMQSAGEGLVHLTGWPLPGPVLGMLLLLPALALPQVREPAGACAELLLQHLSLLFVPVGVGVMTHLDVLTQHGLRLAGVIVLSTWTGLAVTALVFKALQGGPRSEGDGELR